jgi:C-terminal processing protease CtpA/Prc
MISRILRTAVVLAFASVAVFAAEDKQRCNVPARECEQQIRQMLSGRRYLGVVVSDGDESGVAIKSIVPDSPADRAELKAGDHIIAVNGHSMRNAKLVEFKETLAGSKAGSLFVIVEREGAMRKFELRMEPYTKAMIDKIVAAHLAQSHPEVAAGSQK